MLKQVFESILSKLGELIAACAHHHVNSIKDFELTLQSLQKKLKSLTAKADDVEEQIKNAELSGQKKRKREVEEWLSEVRSIESEVVELGAEVESAGFIRRFMSGGKAARLNEEVDRLVEQSRHFDVLLVDVRGTRGEKLLTDRMVGIAFQENFERIWRLLVTGQVSSIGVHGMGGVGKTTLAKHIHNRVLQQSERQHVLHVFWVTVSHEFTTKNLQDKIARSVGVHLSDEDNEDIRAGRLHRALSEMKNAVLILDDVWEKIDLVKVGCPFSVECCRLIITTRSLEVCRQIGCQKVIAVQKLDEDEAWNLFNETFTVGEEFKIGPQVEAIAKSMARLCDGLPLGIVTLAASMRGETAVHTWTNALVELKDSVVGQNSMREVEVFTVLKYSFNRLNTNHERGSNEEFNLFQLCFLYCSLYPEDHEIPRNELVRKFISEGLVDERKSRRAQVDQGHFILDKLVNVCLLESSANLKRVKMHDLVRGMALKIGGGKYMVRAGDKSLKEIPMEQEWTNDLEKVSLMCNEISIIGEGTSPNCPKLSTLLLCYNPLEVIPGSFFSKMQGLCTLDLCGTKISTLANSISDLTSLKALLLKHCEWLENVPYLGKLKALRELNFSHTAIKEVPQGVEELLNLKFLSIDAHKLEVLRRGLLLELVRLQYVEFPYHLEVAIEEIVHLKQLEKFRGRVKNVHDLNCFITSGQSLMHDTFYTIQVGSPCEEYFESYNKEVILSEYNLKDEKVLGQGIECLSIDNCEGLSNCLLDQFSPSNYQSSLKMLKIERCGGIECIFTSEQELPSQLSTLEVIELEWLEDLKGLIHRQEIIASPAPAQSIFSSLTTLKIHKCNKSTKLGLPVWGFPNLKEFEIERCGEIEEIFEDEGRGSLNLPRLKVFSVWGLPRLKSICYGTMICDSIQKMFIVKCPRLMKKLPLHVELDVPPPPTLRVIGVEREWWETLEWENPNLPHLLQPFVKFISYNY